MWLGSGSVLGMPSELLLWVSEREMGGKNRFPKGYCVGICNLGLIIGEWIFGYAIPVQTNSQQNKRKSTKIFWCLCGRCLATQIGSLMKKQPHAKPHSVLAPFLTKSSLRKSGFIVASGSRGLESSLWGRNGMVSRTGSWPITFCSHTESSLRV